MGARQGGEGWRPSRSTLLAILQMRSLRPREEAATPLEGAAAGLEPKPLDSVTMASAATGC